MLDFDATSAPDALGSITVDCARLRLDVISDGWYPLQYMSGSSLRPTGSLRLRLLRTQSLASASLREALRLVREAETESRTVHASLLAAMGAMRGGAWLGHPRTAENGSGLMRKPRYLGVGGEEEGRGGSLNTDPAADARRQGRGEIGGRHSSFTLDRQSQQRRPQSAHSTAAGTVSVPGPTAPAAVVVAPAVGGGAAATSSSAPVLATARLLTRVEQQLVRPLQIAQQRQREAAAKRVVGMQLEVTVVEVEGVPPAASEAAYDEGDAGYDTRNGYAFSSGRSTASSSSPFPASSPSSASRVYVTVRGVGQATRRSPVITVRNAASSSVASISTQAHEPEQQPQSGYNSTSSIDSTDGFVGVRRDTSTRNPSPTLRGPWESPTLTDSAPSTSSTAAATSASHGRLLFGLSVPPPPTPLPEAWVAAQMRKQRRLQKAVRAHAKAAGVLEAAAAVATAPQAAGSDNGAASGSEGGAYGNSSPGPRALHRHTAPTSAVLLPSPSAPRLTIALFRRPPAPYPYAPSDAASGRADRSAGLPYVVVDDEAPVRGSAMLQPEPHLDLPAAASPAATAGSATVVPTATASSSGIGGGGPARTSLLAAAAATSNVVSAATAAATAAVPVGAAMLLLGRGKVDGYASTAAAEAAAAASARACKVSVEDECIAVRGEVPVPYPGMVFDRWFALTPVSPADSAAGSTPADMAAVASLLQGGGVIQPRSSMFFGGSQALPLPLPDRFGTSAADVDAADDARHTSPSAARASISLTAAGGGAGLGVAALPAVRLRLRLRWVPLYAPSSHARSLVVSAELASAGVSIIDADPRELLYCSVSALRVSYAVHRSSGPGGRGGGGDGTAASTGTGTTGGRSVVALSLGHVQVDCQLPGSVQPVVVVPILTDTEGDRDASGEDGHTATASASGMNHHDDAHPNHIPTSTSSSAATTAALTAPRLLLQRNNQLQHLQQQRHTIAFRLVVTDHPTLTIIERASLFVARMGIEADDVLLAALLRFVISLRLSSLWGVGGGDDTSALHTAAVAVVEDARRLAAAASAAAAMAAAEEAAAAVAADVSPSGDEGGTCYVSGGSGGDDSDGGDGSGSRSEGPGVLAVARRGSVLARQAGQLQRQPGDPAASTSSSSAPHVEAPITHSSSGGAFGGGMGSSSSSSSVGFLARAMRHSGVGGGGYSATTLARMGIIDTGTSRAELEVLPALRAASVIDFAPAEGDARVYVGDLVVSPLKLDLTFHLGDTTFLADILPDVPLFGFANVRGKGKEEEEGGGGVVFTCSKLVRGCRWVGAVCF